MATQIERTTARLMLRKLQAELNTLYEEQEASKGAASAAEEMKCGGKVKRKKMLPGGVVASTIANLGKKVNIDKLMDVAPKATSPTAKGAWKDAFTGWERFLGRANQATDWLGDNAGNMAYGAAALAPVLYNTVQGLRKPDLLNARDYYNPNANKAMSLMANRRFNVDPLLMANRGAQANYSRNVLNASGGNRAQLLGGLGAGLNQRMAGDAAAYAQKQNMDLGYLGEEAQFMYGVGRDRANTDYMVDDANQATMAARRNYLGQAASDLSMFAQNNRLMNNQRERDQQLGSLFPDMFAQVYPFMSGLQGIVNGG